MTTVTRPVKARKKALPPEPVAPVTELCDYDQTTGVGRIKIDGITYVVIRLCRDGRTVGVALCRHDAKADRMIRHDVIFAVKPWACDCADAQYRSREGGCKHVVALHQVADQLRCTRTAKEVVS